MTEARDMQIRAQNAPLSSVLVEATGFEPTTLWSRTIRATNCATPRFPVNYIFICRRRQLNSSRLAKIIERQLNRRKCAKSLPRRRRYLLAVTYYMIRADCLSPPHQLHFQSPFFFFATEPTTNTTISPITAIAVIAAYSQLYR